MQSFRNPFRKVGGIALTPIMAAMTRIAEITFFLLHEQNISVNFVHVNKRQTDMTDRPIISIDSIDQYNKPVWLRDLPPLGDRGRHRRRRPRASP